ncbi:hypothetical protein NQ315_013061 [Exocentrus adspersus]|uniref:Uncharacterized protein n=1 Tax=Exocentrus adspersus TaxID=1586481 RepID=A0AAV8VVY7_9CUCU|nr:hypothetical protein NQ315_013061 [Exocentrus adspersus]
MENFELEDAVKEVMDGILPKKSRKIYEAQYDTFVKWCCQRKLENVNEEFYFEGYKPKNAKVLTLDQIDKFLLEVPDKDFLMIKHLYLVSRCLRGKELHQLTISDVTDMDHAVLVNVRNTKNNVDRNFIINNSNKIGIDLIEVCRKYMALRKPETTHSRFLFGMRKVNVLFKPLEKTLLEKYHKKWQNT